MQFDSETLEPGNPPNAGTPFSIAFDIRVAAKEKRAERAEREAVGNRGT